MKRLQSLLLLVCVVSFGTNPARGAGKKPPLAAATDGKKTIMIDSFPDISITLPDGTIHNFGEDFEASLISQFIQSNNYVVVSQAIPSPKSLAGPSTRPMMGAFSLGDAPSPYRWAASVTPAVTVRVEVAALAFETGFRGERMFYGFNERTPVFPEEFPLKLLAGVEPGWFGSYFKRTGIIPFDSQSGLDIGDGFKIDALMVWMNAKYARYHSELRLRLFIDTPLAKAKDFVAVEVKGNGFFFDVAGAYQNYSAGIRLARRDAMNQVLKKALAGSYGAITRALAKAPMMGQIDVIMPDGTLLLGTGSNSQLRPGVLFQVVNSPDLIIEVTQSADDGSLGRLSRGNLSQLTSGMLIQQVSQLPLVASSAQGLVRSTALAGAGGSQQRTALATGASVLQAVTSGGAIASDETTLADANLPPPDFNGLVPSVSRVQAFVSSVLGGIFLPYRIARYFMYDQSYHRYPDLFVAGKEFGPNWQMEPWAYQIGLNQLPDMATEQEVTVAIIDSGLDYNHPWIHDSLWLNPSPWTDPAGKVDHYGWDFISNDSRPFDDGYHGTQVASLVTRVAPLAKIMPLKVFNPSGITSSAAMYSAFVYAVDHGAKIILCPWSTLVKSNAIQSGMEYAQSHDVVIVAAAGDDGTDIEKYKTSPAIFKQSSQASDHLLVVTGVDMQDQLVQVPQKAANFNPRYVQIAAPGQELSVAEPRAGLNYATSTGLAAALVAAGIARNIAAEHADLGGAAWIAEILNEADSIESLSSKVELGRRLHLRK